MIWSVLLAIATFVVGVYVGVRWQRGTAARDLARLRRDMLAMYQTRPAEVAQSTVVAKFPTPPNNHQYVNRTIDP